jgi:MFS family permease
VNVDSVRHRYVWLQALRWLPIGFLAPLLVLFLVDRGLTLGEVGPVLAVYGITTAVLELPTGGLADTIGRRPVLLLSAALNIVFLSMFLTMDGVLGLSVAAFIGGVSRALDSGPLEAWFVDTTRGIDADADLEKGLSLAGTLDGVALAVGAVAGGFLPQMLGGDLDVSFIAALVFSGVHLVAVALLMNEPRSGSHGVMQAAFREVPRVVAAGATLAVRNGIVRRFVIAFVALGVAMSALEVLWQPRFADLLGEAARNTGFFGILLAIAFGAAGLGASLAPAFRRRLGTRVAPALTAGQALMAGATLALAATGAAIPAAAAFVAVYFFNGLIHTYLAELLHEHVPADRRTTMVSVRSLSLQSGGFAGNLTLPALAAVYGIPLAWVIGGVLLGASSLLYVGIPNRPALAAATSESAA